jgi:hypothetical protein
MAWSLVPGVSKIAVLRANALGDYPFSVPALLALKASYPDAELVLLGAPWHERFLTGRPGPVDRVLVVPAAPGVRAEEPDDPMLASAAATFRDNLRSSATPKWWAWSGRHRSRTSRR